MWTVKTIKGEYSHQGLGEANFYKFDDLEEAKTLFESLKGQKLTVVLAPTSFYKPWSEIEKLMISCA